MNSSRSDEPIKMNNAIHNNRNVVVSPSGEIIVLPQPVTFDPRKYNYYNDSNDGSSCGSIGSLDIHQIWQEENEEESKRQDEHAHNVLLRHVSLELLNPVYECHTRKSSIMVAIVNLVATSCGGGVLSLPLAFKRAGIIPTTIFMIYGVLATDFSLYILVSCARRTGGRSYGDVAKAAFGNAAEVLTTVVLVLTLVGSLTAYLVLVKDIWTPVLLSLLPMFLKEPLLVHEKRNDSDIETIAASSTQDDYTASKEATDFILLAILIVGTPLLLKHDLHALRHTCYVGLASCAMLMVALVYRAFEKMYCSEERHDKLPPLNWYSTDVGDLTFAFPIVVLCFLCSFNVLGVHSSLLNPTRTRIKFVLDSSMMICCFLFYIVGLAGYLYARDETRDNILLNFPMSDKAVLLGRLGFCFTLLFALPLVTLPCRKACRAIPVQLRAWRIDASLAKEFKEVDMRRSQGAHLVINGVDFDESERLLVTEDPEMQHATMLTYGSAHNVTHVIGAPQDDDETTAATSSEGIMQTHSGEEPDCPEGLNLGSFIHVACTFAVVGTCFLFAISVPGVGFVWSLAGSSMAILVAFILPTACYLKIREHKRINPRSISACTLLVISCIAAPICTRQALLNG